jgi:hypothetical protein
MRLGRIADDRLCQCVTIQYGEAPHGCVVKVWPFVEHQVAVEALKFSPEEAAMADAALVDRALNLADME